jgi:hypothetical protein
MGRNKLLEFFLYLASNPASIAVATSGAAAGSRAERLEHELPISP